jgi:hypothetical protein
MGWEVFRYAASLLRERQQALDALEAKYRGRVSPPADYLSCRRSLLQAIGQLRALLRTEPEAESATD